MTKIQLLRAKILVELEPEPDKFDGYENLIKPESTHDSAIGWGRVMELGPGYDFNGKTLPIKGIKVGDRVAFVKFLKEGQTNKAIAKIMGDDKLLIEARDVVVVEPC